MGDSFLAIIVLLFIIAVITRDGFVFTLIYLLCGVVVLGNLWNKHVLEKVHIKRKFTNKTFPYIKLSLELVIQNQSRLPMIWLSATDHLPVDIITRSKLSHVISLSGKQSTTIKYEITPTKRGVYPIGPLSLYAGDLLGLTKDYMQETKEDTLIVYPRVVNINNILLSSRAPLGTLKHHIPVFEDPTRAYSKRDYYPGDSLRRVDWKTSAVVGKLLVKLYEPSISLDTTILLNLNNPEYEQRHRYEDTEFSITLAASICKYLVRKKQIVGLSTNGSESKLLDGPEHIFIPSAKGNQHLMRIFESLAKIRNRDAISGSQLLSRTISKMNWGSTLIIITGLSDETLFSEIFRARHAGISILLVICGHHPAAKKILYQALHFGIYCQYFENELDLAPWQIRK
jgi:uncharacterized protein (DUF58 family)